MNPPDGRRITDKDVLAWLAAIPKYWKTAVTIVVAFATFVSSFTAYNAMTSNTRRMVYEDNEKIEEQGRQITKLEKDMAVVLDRTAEIPALRSDIKRLIGINSRGFNSLCIDGDALEKTITESVRAVVTEELKKGRKR